MPIAPMPRRRPAPALLAVVALVVAVGASGCSSSSFVGRRTDNFTAYYNKFYNAQKKYESGVKANEKADQPIDRNHYLSLFSGSRQIQNANDFEESIKKSSDVLRKHPTSKWVDDALLLIGKARFYQQNFVGAEEKFNEVILLGSGLEDEARFWLARTLVASGAYDKAEAHIKASLAQDDLSERWTSMLRLAFSELHVRRENWEEAAAALEDGLEYVRDNDLGSRAQFLLAQVYETLGRYEDAVAAYRRVLDYKPLYELSYAAQVSAVRVEGLYVDAATALRTLRRMERDDKHFGYRGELAFLRGRILHAEGAYDDALYIYDELLYEPDDDLNITAVRGRIHYALGELFRDGYEDYLLAAAHFDTAATALRQPAGTASTGAVNRRAPAAVVDADEQAEMFKQFATVMTKTARMDSLLYVGALDDEAFDAFVLDLRAARAAELAAQQRELDRRQAEQRFSGSAAAASRPANTSGNAATGSAGFLYHKDMMRVQEGLRNFAQRWGDRPRVPNWRRADAIDEALAEKADPDAPAGAQAEGGVAGALPQIDISDVPRDSLAQATMRADRAMARYELANVLFLSMNRPDSAAAWYRMVIEEDRDQPVAQRAYYALAEVQHALGDTLAARRLYESILERYPDSDFADRVRERLGRAPVVSNRPDSLALAERAYGDAYSAWRLGRHAAAMKAMLEVAATYADTPVAARALFAVGSIYTEWATRDSLDLFATLTSTLPDSLLEAAGLTPKAGAPASLGTTAAATQAPPATAASATPPPADAASQAPVRAATPPGPAETTAEAPALTGELAGKPGATRTRPDTAAKPEVRADTPLAEVQAAEAQAAEAQAAEAQAAEAQAAEAQAAEVQPTSPADSLSTPPDGEVLAADSLGVVEPVAVGIAAETLAKDAADAPAEDVAAAPAAVTIETLYASVADRYPNSPFAQRARAVLEALAERREPALSEDAGATDAVAAHTDESVASTPPDTSVTPDSSRVTPGLVADSAAVLATAAADTSATGPDDAAAERRFDDASADSTIAELQRRRDALQARALQRAAGDDSAAAETPGFQTTSATPSDGTPDDVAPKPAPKTTSAGDTPTVVLRNVNGRIDLAQGGLTFLLGTVHDAAEANALFMSIAQSVMRPTDDAPAPPLALLHDTVAGTPRYRIILGQFPTAAQAQIAEGQIADRMPEGMELPAAVPID